MAENAIKDWQNNTVAELIHGPFDGKEIILPPSDRVVEIIEVPIFCESCREAKNISNNLPIRLGIYRRDGGTLKFHSGAPATVKFRYQETREEKEIA